MRTGTIDRRFVVGTALALILAGTAACSQGQQTKTQTKTQTQVKAAASAKAQAQYVGHLQLEPTSGTIGSRVTVTGSGLPKSTSFNLVWDALKGHWVLKGKQHENYDGRAFVTVNKVLAQVRSDAAGDLKASFTVPRGFGFGHTVQLVQDGTVRNQARFSVKPQAWLASSKGPEGSPIRITLEGIGARSYHNNWMLVYDNKFTGWISSVTTGGTAHVTIPATGGVGRHVISIIHGAYTFPYLISSKQSPHPKPKFRLVYTVTPGNAVLPPALSTQGIASAPGRAPAGSGRAAWVNPASGPVGTPLLVSARDLPAGAAVTVDWQTVVGNRVTAAGWKAKTVTLGKASVAADGSLSFRVQTPSDLGGTHAIRVVGSGGKVLASTSFTLTPSAVSISRTRGPVGTRFDLHLLGVGWTETANIYTLDYDNAYEGYVCGFNTNGNVIIPMVATGRPGWHFIDLYPSIYKGHEIRGTNDFRLPQLTFERDHPGERKPAFHFAFYVTGG